MKISFIGTRGVPATYSGFETAVEQIGRRLASRGHEVTVFCRSTHFRDKSDYHQGMRLVHLPALPQKHLETLTHTTLSSLLIAHDNAVVCMGVGNAPVVAIWEALGKRVVFNVDGADWQREKWGRFAAWYLKMCESLAARSNALLIADSLAVQKHYRDSYARPTDFVPYGAEPPKARGTETLLQFGLTPGGYNLFVGRLVPENGVHDIIAAIKGYDSRPLVVVGDAPYAAAYIQEIKRHAPRSVIFTGYQFGVNYEELTANAGVFILGATVGGTHPVLLEQMAAGNCVLARDTPSNREVLQDAGLIWSTPSDLHHALETVWSDESLRVRLGSAAARRSVRNYDWDAIADQYLSLAEESVKKP